MINRVIPPPFFEDWNATMRDATRIDTSESSLKDLLLDRVLQNAKIFQLTITREGGNEIRVPETVDWPPFDRFISWPRNVKQPAPGGSFAKIYRHDRGNGAKLLYRVVNCAQRRNLAISDRIDKPSLCTWYWFENEPLYLEIENFGNLLTKTVKRRQSWYVNGVNVFRECSRGFLFKLHSHLIRLTRVLENIKSLCKKYSQVKTRRNVKMFALTSE